MIIHNIFVGILVGCVIPIDGNWWKTVLIAISLLFINEITQKLP